MNIENNHTMDMQDFILKHRIDKNKHCMRIPLFVHVEITTRCNVGCPQCYCSSIATGDDMDYLLYTSIIDEISDLKIPSVLLTGGEPLLHSKLIKMIEYAVQKNIKVIISTSGYGLNEEICKELSNSGVGEICVSINGSNQNIHSLSRGHFASAVNALKLLTKHRINVRVNWVARQDNFMDFSNLVDLCMQSNVNSITVLSNKKKNGIIISPMNYENIIELYETIQEQRKRINIEIDPCFIELIRLTNQSVPLMICNAGLSFFDILVDGGMIPCRHANSSKCFFGEKSIKEYWRSEKLQHYRDNKQTIGRSCK